MTVPDAVLVVDFGTSTSSAALVVGGQIRMVAEPATGSWSWPSAVYLDGAQLLVGTLAQERRSDDPLAYSAEFKRVLDDPEPVPLGAAAFTPGELVAAVLGELREEAGRQAGRPLDRVLCTVPATYTDTDPRCDLMIAAAERAGFAEVELLPEPVAAAFAPVSGPTLPAGEVVLVYDLGGGTFDAALVEIGEGAAHRVLGHAALDGCGGRDVDALLLRRFRAQGGDRVAALLRVPEAEDGDGDGDDAGGADDRAAALYAAMQLADLARGAKHQLTSAPSANPYYLPARSKLAVAREDLAALVAPLLDATITCCRELADGAGVPMDTVAQVLLVGGSSRMPVVAATVESALRRPVRLAESPSTAVVEGAARWVVGAAANRLLAPAAPGPQERPVRWELPGGDATLLRWCAEPGADLDAGAEVAVVRLRDGTLRTLTVDGGLLHRVHADPGARVATGDWLVTLGASPEPEPAVQHGARVVGLAFDAAGRLVTAGVDGRLLTWEDARPVASTVLDADGVREVAFGRDAGHVASLGLRIGVPGGDLRIWAQGREVRRVTVPADTRAVALSPDGHRLAIAGRGVRVVAAASGEDLLARQLPADVVSVAFSHDCARLAITTEHPRLHVWDAATGEELAHRGAHHAPLGAVAFSPDGRRLCTLRGGEVLLHDGTGEVVATLAHGSPVGATAFVPGGRVAIAGIDGELRILDPATGERLLERSFGRPLRVARAHPDGTCVAVATDDGSVHVVPTPPR